MSTGLLTFGCVPHTDDDETRAHLAELCAWLTRHLGVEVQAHRAGSPEALAAAFAERRVDIAWVSPALLVTSAGLTAARPLVCSVRQGLASYHTVLFVERGSTMRSQSDLKGARVAWVSPTSAAGYIVPRLSLAAHGLDPRDLFASETFHDSHGNVVRAVMERRAEVGATYAVFEGGDPTKPLVRAGFLDVPGADARILHAAGPIPSDPVVIAPTIDGRRRVQLLDAFVSGHEEILAALEHVLGTRAFEAVRLDAFDALRADIYHARELGLLDA